jgi:hypothetical protein
MRRARYRARQLLWGLRSAIDPDDAREVRELLSSAELPLFLRMEPRDRRHSLLVMRRLAREGIPSTHGAADAGADPAGRDLLVAALLHDVGKGRLALWHRVIYVPLHAAVPPLLDRLAREGSGWRGALWRLRHHAPLSAALLREARSAERVVELVERHLTPPAAARAAGDAELLALIAADSAS